MNILIAGDSWGLGEWMRGDLGIGTSHTGLEHYLSEIDHNVVNLSIAGGSNLQILRRLTSFLERHPDKKFDQIFVFQTEYTRDYPYAHEDDWTHIKHANDLAHIWLARFYSGLSEISKKYNITIDIIGGCCDTVWLDDFDAHYPGVNIICQSLVNLITKNQPRITNPVLSWYTRSTVDLIKKLNALLPDFEKNQLLDLIDLGFERENLVWGKPKYFFPDGIHANRHGHKILFDYIKTLRQI